MTNALSWINRCDLHGEASISGSRSDRCFSAFPLKIVEEKFAASAPHTSGIALKGIT
jgi:hypothetical protein